MLDVAALLRASRQRTGLSLDELQRWSGVNATEIAGAEDGKSRLSAAELDSVARVFGLRLDDFLAGEQGQPPMAPLLRSGSSYEQLDIRGILTTEIHWALGEFQRVVRDIAELQGVLNKPTGVLPGIDFSGAAAKSKGEARAEQVRKLLGLGAEPIASMASLLRQLGIVVVWVTEDHVHSTVDGACVQHPVPAMLINLIEEGKHPWRARITMAHELSHLLFDLTSNTRGVVVSPHLQRLPLGLEEAEKNARAFAACFLAPTSGVLECVGTMDPKSEEAIGLVGSRFGVGRTVAINRLQNVYSLTDSQRRAMQERPTKVYQGIFEGDEPPEYIGFRGEPLLGLVNAALRAGLISGTRARQFLGLKATDELPFDDLAVSVKQPLISNETRLIRAALHFLAKQYPTRAFVSGSPERVHDNWRVPVFNGGAGATLPTAAGYLLLSNGAELIEDAVTPLQS